MAEGTATVARSELGVLAVQLLQRLIREDTVNPPGNERRIQQELKGLLEAAGFEVELLAAEPERANLVGTLEGEADGPGLTLLSHVDTVRADPGEWAQDPWGGELIDGYVWGRGAVDMKGQVAAELAACLALGRTGWRPPRGRLRLVITADEETGGHLGARWLCEQHPDKVRSDFVLNEGGGASFELQGRRLYPYAVGEKGIFRATVRTRGRAGHASQPRIGENALLKLAPLIARLGEQPPLEPTVEGCAFLAALYDEPVKRMDDVERALDRLRSESPRLATILAEPILGTTLTPTRVSASQKANIIPSAAEVLVDCRQPPGRDTGDARERIEAVLGPGDYEIEFGEEVVGNRSPAESELEDAIRSWIDETDAGAGLVPSAMPGFSDSHWFRQAFPDAAVYGFCPQRDQGLLDSAPLIHGADERALASDVELAARFFSELPRRLLV
ncbi:MAG TPA: M20/M25/M40 family metallo-hydrolase [Solirubrobacterales bacterium]|jgi:acetylornithine deacetylase/succinyl-diaminopimelate desuccinylase-like protein|nr:M20/M25/M40 family metallo-hydrolase [Solirubrobacterales bacterium]